MIKNDRKPPIIIESLSVLLKRIPTNPRRKEIEDHLAKHKAGFRGEQSLDYFYRYLPQDEIILLHNMRILHDEYYFQIDTLILTPHFFIVLEIKNISGHIYFDHLFSQMIRTSEGNKESFDDPIQQVHRQAYHLSETLKLHKIPFIPIESLVVITNPKSLVESATSHKDAIAKVIKSADLKTKFELFKEKHKEQILTKKDLRKVNKILVKLHTPYHPNVCNLYQIKQTELLKGVFCPECENSFLLRRKRSWLCTDCNHTYPKAHVSALKDYALLVSTEITNRECKEFLNLSSSSEAYHLLSGLQLPYSGYRKSRKYHLHQLIEI
ncbi:NERD domain-containing protein [Fictibacillus nanhaiensis]|uniref:nuclease-related domain-containing protein n=1 Tax=Fictibacillus nanhaiensis TaxID=742169 RepID=UPI001C94850D|nr:nuclease-related domain-containing protein [Fictibacillus nanhaiensis]MBY6037019.1 NERD domain-containing protein [Fictibacillus nanhaiensis]